MIRIVMAVCLALVLAGCVSKGESAQAENRAVIDSVRTSEVLDAVREGVRVAFTVESSSLSERQEKIAPYVTEAGARAVDDVLREDLVDAETTPLSVTASITDAAVSLLDGDRATVVVLGARVREDESRFAEQRTMLIGVRQVAGVWRIDSVSEQLTGPDPERTGDAPAAERDSAIAAARRLAAAMITFDENDRMGSIDRRVEVSTGPLADRLRAIPADELDAWGTKTADPDESFGAATSVQNGRATVLLAIAAANVDDGTERPYQHLCWISLARDASGAWKARDFHDVDTLGLG